MDGGELLKLASAVDITTVPPSRRMTTPPCLDKVEFEVLDEYKAKRAKLVHLNVTQDLLGASNSEAKIREKTNTRKVPHSGIKRMIKGRSTQHSNSDRTGKGIQEVTNLDRKPKARRVDWERLLVYNVSELPVSYIKEAVLKHTSLSEHLVSVKSCRQRDGWH
ncbi:hypothetical protein NGRA_1758 [Nosema granulosis]|uniref:Uncharacterized protein n=1 Tax=Nosema granulosis TaxID=83296 RepID=A0A9P6GXX5_9MICR|nr:hypothetical protein NGRA_1758 [Nosema granulosis]